MSALEPPDGPVAAPPGDESPPPADVVPPPDEPPSADEPHAAEDEGPEEDEPEDEEEVLAQYPPVVAVVVTRNPGPWLEGTLAGLAQQDYDDLTVLVVDCGSRDDPTPRVATVLPRAFVRRLDDGAGFADAANEALHAVEGAT
jgi:cellulose synthase/poly-beta-1,6-N-acetylglucosamine synthase-like glycosyltransferase